MEAIFATLVQTAKQAPKYYQESSICISPKGAPQMPPLPPLSPPPPPNQRSDNHLYGWLTAHSSGDSRRTTRSSERKSGCGWAPSPGKQNVRNQETNSWHEKQRVGKYWLTLTQETTMSRKTLANFGIIKKQK